MKARDLERLTDLAMDYSLAVRPGHIVVVSGPDVAEDFLRRLFEAVLARAGLPVIRLRGDLYRQTLLHTTGDDRDRWLNPLGVPDGSPIDRSLGIWTAGPPGSGACDASPASPNGDERARQGAFLHAAAERKLRWLALFYPTPAAARAATMSAEDFTTLVAAADMLDTPDPAAAWQEAFDRQQRLCTTLGKADTIRFTTPEGTDLTVGVAGRTWINNAGHRNLPDGEIFTAPVESGVHGTFVADLPVLFRGQVIRGARLEFNGGRLVRTGADEGSAALRDLAATDPGASRVGEIALGLNPRRTAATTISLLDEKIGGTFHVGIGAAYPETGGTNSSVVHRDFIADLRRGGRIDVDGEPFEIRIGA